MPHPLQHAFVTLLGEIFDGTMHTPGGYILNPKDPGLLAQLESIDASVASTRPMPGQTTIAAHVDHVCYGLSLLNRDLDGEPDVFQTADWKASWRRTQVDGPTWRELIQRLRREASRWQERMKTHTDWSEEVGTCGSLASLPRTAYHLGAIRQLLAAQGQNRAPGEGASA